MLPQIFETTNTLYAGIRTVSSGAYTTVEADDGLVIDVDTSAAPITVTLKTAASTRAGYRVAVRKKTSDANAVTVSGPSVGVTTLRTQGDLTLNICTGSTYYALSMAGPDLTVGVLRAADGTAAAPSYTFDAARDIGFCRPGAGILAFSANGTEIWRSTSSRNFLIGNIGSGRTIAGLACGIQAEGINNTSGISQVRNSNDISGPASVGAKSRGTVVLDSTICQSGDQMYRIIGAGADGVDIATLGCEIRFVVDAAPAANRMPGRMSFFTAAGSADDDLAEKMRLNSAGQLVVGTTSYVGSERVRVSGGSAATATSTDVIMGGGAIGVGSTTDATSKTTGAAIIAGGLGLTKNAILGQGLGIGVTSTATAAGTTTLTSASTTLQIFTGTTTQNVTLPAANVFGSGVGAVYIIKNRSTGALTVNRAGSDTIEGATSLTIAAGVTETLISNGSAEWERC